MIYEKKKKVMEEISEGMVKEKIEKPVPTRASLRPVKMMAYLLKTTERKLAQRTPRIGMGEN